MTEQFPTLASIEILFQLPDDGKHDETPHKAFINPLFSGRMSYQLSDPLYCGGCWCAFLLHFTTEVILLYFSEILWCCYSDVETPAVIIKVLSNNQNLMKSSCFETDQHKDAISI